MMCCYTYCKKEFEWVLINVFCSGSQFPTVNIIFYDFNFMLQIVYINKHLRELMTDTINDVIFL